MAAVRPDGGITDSPRAQRAILPVSVPSTGCSCGVALQGRRGRAYNQEAFRHLLAIEQARAHRSRRSLLLVLIGIRNESGERVAFVPRIAAQVFDALWFCIRDIDLTGWYSQDRIAGAVLVQDRAIPAADDMFRIQQRINGALQARVPSGVAPALRVRVLQVRDMRQRLEHSERGVTATVPGVRR